MESADKQARDRARILYLLIKLIVCLTGLYFLTNSIYLNHNHKEQEAKEAAEKGLFIAALLIAVETLDGENKERTKIFKTALRKRGY